MKTLYLHIGMPKTGTTYLQTFLTENNSVLNEDGYSYPDFGVRFHAVGQIRNGHFLVGTVKDDNGVRDRKKEAQIENECFEKLFGIFEEYDNIILSDEQIWLYAERCRSWDFWDNLKRRLDERDIYLRVIIYLRRQDAFVQSYWAQKVKSHTHEVPPTVQEYMKSESFSVVKLNYYRRLNYIAEHIGKENIKVRVYERKQFVGGSLSADFLNTVGLEYDERYSEPEQLANSSISGIYLETKKELNKVTEPTVRGGYMQALITQAYEKFGTDEEPVYGENFTLEEAKALLRKYRSCNVKIGREYLGRTDRKLFLEKPRKVEYNEGEHTVTDYVRVLSQMLAIQKEKLDRYYITINRLTPEVKELRAEKNILIRNEKSLNETIENQRAEIKKLNSAFGIRVQRKLNKLFRRKNNV